MGERTSNNGWPWEWYWNWLANANLEENLGPEGEKEVLLVVLEIESALSLGNNSMELY